METEQSLSTQNQEALFKAAKFGKTWDCVAREDQLPPDFGIGYSVWLFMAGRGAGKTRSGAEWVREKVRIGCRRIGLIAPTAGDVRDVMVEGTSGLLSVCWEFDQDVHGKWMGSPTYEPSKRRVTWANGAMATTYSAEEPDRLRGPQHDAIWCFVAGTMIATPDDGEQAIETLQPGDLVLTRQGVRRVVATGVRPAETGRVEFSNGKNLVGTADHPVCLKSGWTNMDHLQIGDTACVIDASRASVVSTWQRMGVNDVYNLQIEGVHEYFANGVLVHNCDEVAAWQYDIDTWDMAMFGLRLGNNPQAMVSTTPKPRPLMRELIKNPSLRATHATTYANRANLAESFFDRIISKYSGTRLGQQELMGQLIEEAEGALWTRQMVEDARDGRHSEYLRVVVAIDPAVTANEISNLTGIIVAALGRDKRGYVIEDISGRFSPNGWAKRAVEAMITHSADCIVAEGNQGGDLVRSNIQTVNKNVNVKMVHASRSKQARAEPVAALYEQRRITHLHAFPELDDQLMTWEPLSGDPSPDRLDALVWALTELMLKFEQIVPFSIPIVNTRPRNVPG